jgi:hypothetical protein
LIAKGQARAKIAVDKIRARGGEVVFVRPPSGPQLRVNEEAQVPKAKGWDVLLRNTHSAGVHIDDLPSSVQNLTLPEYSHLTRRCSVVFTDAYVRRLTELNHGRIYETDPNNLGAYVFRDFVRNRRKRLH